MGHDFLLLAFCAYVSYSYGKAIGRAIERHKIRLEAESFSLKVQEAIELVEGEEDETITVEEGEEKL